MKKLKIINKTHDNHSYSSERYHCSQPKFIIIHYSDLNFESSLEALTQHVSSHYLISQSQDITCPDNCARIFQLVDEKRKAWHAGVSYWGQYNDLNNYSIGIENVYLPIKSESGIKFPCWCRAQLQLLVELCKKILSKYPRIEPTQVLGHSDIAYNRKIDPGPCFPWYLFYQAGIGAWYDEKVKNTHWKFFNKKPPNKKEIIENFVRYGYRKPRTKRELTLLVQAFQMHFRNHKYDGYLDAETTAILYALVDRYNPL